MAVRFDASGELYTRSTGLGSQTAISVSCWVKISVLHSFYSTVWEFGTSAGALTLRTDTNGTTMGVLAAGTASNSLSASRSLTVGTWYYFGTAVSYAADSGLMVSRADTDSSFTVNTWSETNEIASFNNFRIGQGVTATTWYFNGCVAALKIWSGVALTQAELEAEAAQFAPVRSANLHAYYRFATASTTDDSGNGRTLSGGTGATTEADPSLSTAVPIADTGSVADALTATASLPLSQTASAADALVGAQTIPLADAGAGVSEVAAAAAVTLADAGEGIDTAANGQPIFFTEAATVAETVAVAAAGSFTETASGGDGVAATAATPLAEAGSGGDALEGSLLLFKDDIADAASAVEGVVVVLSRDIKSIGAPRGRYAVGTPRRT